jgi:hypothetical protein
MDEKQGQRARIDTSVLRSDEDGYDLAKMERICRHHANIFDLTIPDEEVTPLVLTLRDHVRSYLVAVANRVRKLATQGDPTIVNTVRNYSVDADHLRSSIVHALQAGSAAPSTARQEIRTLVREVPGSDPGPSTSAGDNIIGGDRQNELEQYVNVNMYAKNVTSSASHQHVTCTLSMVQRAL